MATEDKDKPKDPSAVALGRKGGLKGGKARKDALTPERRSEIARAGAEAKHRKSIPRATHDGTLHIGDMKIPCANLGNGLRVVSQRGFYAAVASGTPGRKKGAADVDYNLPAFLSAANLKPYVSSELTTTARPIEYVALPPAGMKGGGGGALAHGIDARLIPDICDVWLKAREAGALHSRQVSIAKKAEVLMRGLARVGIIALIDEATGYQYDRAAQELQAILADYVRPDMKRYLPVFKTEFFRLTYELHGWTFKPGNHSRPGYVGTLINEWIYKRLPRPVLPELQRLNPNINGRRRNKHYWHLTEDTGLAHVERQQAVVIALLRVARRDKARFNAMLIEACPIHGDQQYLPFPETDEPIE